jgi:hypothetical protein
MQATAFHIRISLSLKPSPVQRELSTIRLAVPSRNFDGTSAFTQAGNGEI